MIRSIKVRLEPNNKQRTKLFRSAGVARWAYNWTLEQQENNYKTVVNSSKTEIYEKARRLKTKRP